MTCADFEKFVSAFVDGELDPPTMRSFEQHRSDCERCGALLESERTVKRAVRASMRRVVAPADLRERIRSSLDRADAARPRRWRSLGAWITPIAAAAAVLLLWFGPGRIGGGADHVRSAGLFDHAASIHAKDLPVEVRSEDPDDVAGWFRGKVNFRARPPRVRHAKLLGARLSHVGERQAAQFVYDRGGRRVTILVYAVDRPIEDGRPVRLPNRELRLGYAQGYTGAVVQRRGLAYVIMSDLGQAETVRLADRFRW